MRARILAACLALGGGVDDLGADPAVGPPIVLVVHGGAGAVRRGEMTPERERELRAGLEKALRTGYAILADGGASLDAVEAAVRVLEDDPNFNAGRGAVFTREGRHEMDAALMEGRTRRAGAVAGVGILKNPIRAARAVMERSPHVLLAGRGAELFATEAGLEVAEPSYFWTERRWKQLQEKLLEESGRKPSAHGARDDAPFGTVGAVALDRAGDLAAATSTGGTTAKRAGRIGDSPLIGAGTLADNESCAVSATGTGEFFIRWTVAADIAALVRYRGLGVREAAEEVVLRKLKAAGGDGGVIVLDAQGRFAAPFNTEGMYRGWIQDDGVPRVALFRE